MRSSGRASRALVAAALCTPALVLAGAASAPASARTATPQTGQAMTWQATAPPALARSGATSTLLPDGSVLVAGGDTRIAELYDPTTRAFTETGRMQAIRIDATATLLPDGAVLLAGGRGPRGRQVASAELYHPGTHNWSPTGSMSVARSGQTATLLASGDVLVAGGGCNPGGGHCDAGSFLNTLSSAELYHSSTGTWASAGHMNSGRQDASAALLADGDVLVAGGFSDCDDDFCEDTGSADLYDPSTGKWSATAHLIAARERAAIAVLHDGSVLVSGGTQLDPDTDVNHPLRSAERYDLTTGTWRATRKMSSAHTGDTSAVLPNGWVLVASGGTAASQVYQPAKGIWVTTGSTGAARRQQTLVSLANGDVLLTGGLDSAATFVFGKGPRVKLSPAALAFGAQQVGSTSAAKTITVTNQGTADLHATGLTFGGPHAGDYLGTTTCIADVPPGGTCTIAVRFAPTRIGARPATVGLQDDAPASPQHGALTGFGNGPGAWAPAGDTGAAREGAASAVLSDGDVLVAGGYSFAGFQDQAARYDPGTRRFTQTGSMLMPLTDISAAVLSNGDVLVAGGYGDTGPTATAELYDPSTGIWSFTGSMLAAGDVLNETPLPNGTVLVTGFPGTRSELYDVTRGTFSYTGSMIEDAQLSAASLLPNGDVLVAGGVLNGDTGAQIYDPTADRWTATGSLHVGRQHSQSVLLQNGKVLVAGGVSTSGVPLASSEVFDPSTGTFSTSETPMSVGRSGFTLTLLPGGDVLAAGGCSGLCEATATASTDLYLPQYDDWTRGGSMTVPRQGATAVLMQNGQVLMSGGTDGGRTIYSSSETFTIPMLTADPDSGAAGTQVTLTGQGFFAFEQVGLTFDSQRLGSTRTRRDGSFTAVVTIPASGLGQHTIRASGKTSYGQGSCTFTVTS